MRIDRTSMGLDDLRRPVAIGTGARATSCHLVVLGVAGGTSGDFGFRLEADRLGVALHACHLRVRRVFEPDLTSSGLMIRNRYLYRHLLGPNELTRLVTGAALSTSGPLMVAYLTSPRRLEGQVAAAGGRSVAGDAGELAMALM
jgi:hypothetical protein